MTFEGWNPRYYGDAMALPGDALAHFRTKGSKNGVRRYQQPDGTWTPLGLRLRKAREGWGETRAERRLARAKAKTQRIKAKAAAKTKVAKEKEKVRAERAKAKLLRNKGKLNDLTDDELRQKINRAKMIQQYKELTRNPVLKAGQDIVKSYLEGKDKREERKLEREKMGVERMRAKVDFRRAIADEVRSRYAAKEEKYKRGQEKQKKKQMKEDRKAGLYKEREANRLRAKKDLRESSVWNKIWTTHTQKKLSKVRVSEDVKRKAADLLGQVEGKMAIDAYNNPVRMGKLGRLFAPKKKEGRARITYHNQESPKDVEERKFRAKVEETRQAEERAAQARANADQARAEAERARYNAEAAKYSSQKNQNQNQGKKKKKGNNS